MASTKNISVVHEAMRHHGLQVHAWIYDVRNGRIKDVAIADLQKSTTVETVAKAETIAPPRFVEEKAFKLRRARLLRIVEWRLW